LAEANTEVVVNERRYLNQEKAGPGSLAFSLVLSFGQCQKKEPVVTAYAKPATGETSGTARD